MDLTPGEKAVLAQIGVLYKEAAGDQLVRALTAQWLSAHYGSYSSAYTALIEKGHSVDQRAEIQADAYRAASNRCRPYGPQRACAQGSTAAGATPASGTHNASAPLSHVAIC
jgi:hypothetical protein